MISTEVDHFYVTLPSDSSADYFPSNTLSKFTTKLAQTIEFNPDDKWYVGLAEISYPFGFDTLESSVLSEDNDMTTNVILTQVGRIVFPARKYASIDDLYFAIRNTVTKFDREETLLNEIQNYNFRDQIATNNLKKNNGDWIQDKSDIKSKYVNTLSINVDNKYDVIVDFPVRLYYGFEDMFATIKNRLPNLEILDAFNSKINTLLTGDIRKIILKPVKRMPHITIHNEPVFIYTDIIAPQFVGDSYVRSLRVIQFPSAEGHHLFQSIYYLPVEKTSIESITVALVDKFGENVKFDSSPVPTIAVLHFMKIK